MSRFSKVDALRSLTKTLRLAVFTIPAVALLGLAFTTVDLEAAASPPPVTISLSRTLLFGTVAGDKNLAGTVTINAATGAKTTTGGGVQHGGNIPCSSLSDQRTEKFLRPGYVARGVRYRHRDVGRRNDDHAKFHVEPGGRRPATQQSG